VSATNADTPSLLTGLVQDETGDRLCPTHANKKGRRYRYYISKRLMHGTGTDGWRLPAKELERVVLEGVRDLLCDELRVVRALRLEGASPDRLRRIIDRGAELARTLTSDSQEHRGLLPALLYRIILHPDSILFEIKPSGLADLLGEPESAFKRSWA
jgi:hypothetical protein